MSVPLWLLPVAWGAIMTCVAAFETKARRRKHDVRRQGRHDVLKWQRKDRV